MKVVLVDDEKSIRVTLGDGIKDAGYEASVFDDGQKAYAHIKENGCDVIVCDLKMPGMDGINLLKSVKEIYPTVQVILITGYGTVETAVEAMKYGAYDYVVKPFINDKIIHMLNNIAAMHKMYDENQELKRKFDKLSDGFIQFYGMVGTSGQMQEVFRMIENVAPTDANVLIEGESGTGKELAARAIHELSTRKNKPITVLSCSSTPDSLLEDELFGHEPGAYTGAVKKKKGKFERADGSTLFIDDIDDMSLGTQVKLVRVLQERTFERLGGNELISADFRIITASKVNLKKQVEKNLFREDLFFRLNIIPIKLPRLREREGDIELLANFFKQKYARNSKAYFSEETIRLMKGYSWPGNVRELENAVLRASVLCGDREEELKKEYIFQEYEPEDVETRELNDAVKQFEREYITKALQRTGFHKSKCSEALGISRKTLWEKIKQYGIE
jgi:DNA-binding NtrC family response regulator